MMILGTRWRGNAKVVPRLVAISSFLAAIACCGCQTTTSILVTDCLQRNLHGEKAAICRDGVAYSLPEPQVLLAASRRKVQTIDSTADLLAAKANFARREDELAKAERDQSKCKEAGRSCDGVEASNVKIATENKKRADDVLAKANAVDQAQADVAKVNAKAVKDTTSVANAQSQLTADTGAKTPVDSKIAMDKKALSDAQNTLQTDQAALNTANRQLATAQAAFPKWQETLTLTVLPNVPDPSARYVANLAHNMTRDDTLKISVVNGLLTSSTVTAVGQAPNLIVQLADAAIALTTHLPAVPAAPAAPVDHAAVVYVPPEPLTESRKPPSDCSYDVAEVFNPLEDTTEVANLLIARGANVQLGIPKTGNQPKDAGAPLQTDVSGLVYRIATPIVLSSSASDDALAIDNPCPSQSRPAAQSILAVLPDSRSSYVVRADAGPFTTTNLSFGFLFGMLTDYTAQRPSELAAVAGIPVRIAQDIVSIPTQLLQLKVNYDTQATALVNAQTSLQQAQLNVPTAITNSQAALVNAQTSLSQAQLNQPIAITNSQTQLASARTALQQAQANQPIAALNSQTALVNANTALSQAQLNQPIAAINSQTALANANAALTQAQAGDPVAIINAQTALATAETALQQAQIGQSTAVDTAKTALVNAGTALKQAQIQQPTAVMNSQSALAQAHAALIQAEAALNQVMSSQTAQ